MGEFITDIFKQIVQTKRTTSCFKQVCNIERFQVRKEKSIRNHILWLCWVTSSSKI